LLVSAPAESTVRVVVAEDSMLLRAGVTRVLEASGFAVIGEAGDAEELLEQARAKRPDVVVTDIRMPPTDSDEGLRAAAAIRGELPDIGVLVLSQHVSAGYAQQLLGGGAAGLGYLLKQRVTEPEGFTRAVRVVARGGCVLDPEVVTHLLDRRRPGGPIDGLTPDEGEVLARLAEGRSNREIARDLECSEHALERHLTSIFAKLDLPPRGEGHRRVRAVLTYLRAQEA
jgi:DNA-binding NarL/FixJ family response regulator